MKIVALEEHLVTREIYDAWQHLPADRRDPSLALYSHGETLERLEDTADRRIGDMDESGVDVQVLSLVSPGLEALDAGDAVAFSRDMNDLIAAAVRRRPDRFEGFAAIATPDPAAAANELERAVNELGLLGAMLNGRIRDRNLDHRSLEPIFAAAEALGCPLYIHPQIPNAKVREIYYSGFGDPLDTAFATGGIGWHYETGMQLLRLILAGVLDRFPRLQIIVGHWGEAVMFYLDRIVSLNAQATSLELPIPEYFRRNVSVTPSGIFSQRYLRWAREVVGIERILFSTDYPFQFAPHGGARAFVEQADLSEPDREKLASGNWIGLTHSLRGRKRST